MKIRIFTCILAVLICMPQSGRAQNAETRQKGLLWEITGNGLKKPSYLYGTMHVSNRIAFHLGDSFYHAVKACDVVALEQNMDSVIDEWLGESIYRFSENYFNPNTSAVINMSTFTLDGYNNEQVKAVLRYDPDEIDQVLYRENSENFEERTWLDLYIYKLGKKTGKYIMGVEDYAESRELVNKAMDEPETPANRKKKRYISPYSVSQIIKEAYRRGELYKLDSIYNLTYSEHYLEYMLYRRNANMVHVMDSVIRSGKGMFTGVGCAHLPGAKGVINMLREKGYSLRPVQSIAVAKSKLSERYESMHYKLTYSSQQSADGAFRVMLPGKMITLGEGRRVASYMYPELVNGVFYTVTRIKTYATLSNRSSAEILKSIDTLLFENLPGEEQKRTSVTINGYKGFDILTKTISGDYSRFCIIPAADDIYIFKLGGRGDYAASKDANRFFRSIDIGEPEIKGWQTIISADSTLRFDVPGNMQQVQLQAKEKNGSESMEHYVYDRKTNKTYLLLQKNLTNYSYLEEDTFELGLMAESLAGSQNYELLDKKHYNWHGYHALDMVCKTTGNSFVNARMLLHGSRYTMFICQSPTRESFEDRFFTNIAVLQPVYGKWHEHSDTAMFYRVMTPVEPTEAITDFYENSYMYNNRSSQVTHPNQPSLLTHYYLPGNGAEMVKVFSYRYSKYFTADSSRDSEYNNEGLQILKHSKEQRSGATYESWLYSDTGTTRLIRIMYVSKGRVFYTLSAMMDSVQGGSHFVNTFFNTFEPLDSFGDWSLYTDKVDTLIKDMYSRDSMTSAVAMTSVGTAYFSGHRMCDLMALIDTFHHKDPDMYRLVKGRLIGKLSAINHPEALAYTEKLYDRLGDTSDFQLALLEGLTVAKNINATGLLKRLIAKDPPVPSNSYELRDLFMNLYDTLELTSQLFPEFIDLTSIDEYKDPVLSLLATLYDSAMITPDIYKSYHTQLVNQARSELKRKMNGNRESYYLHYGYANTESDLERYTKLILPLKDKYPYISNYIRRLKAFPEPSTRVSLITLLLNKNEQVEDSIFETLAKNRETRLALYTSLEESKRLDRYPQAYRSQKELLEAALWNSKSSSYRSIDSMSIAMSRTINIKGLDKKLYLMQYRYEDEDGWFLALAQPQPMDSTIFDSNDMRFITQPMNITQTLDKQFNDLCRKLELKRRRGYYSYFDDSEYNLQSYLSGDY